MNKDNLNKLIEHLETQTTCGFNMQAFFNHHLPDQSPHRCGTTACLGGHIQLLTHKAEKPVDLVNLRLPMASYLNLGCEFLGLSIHQVQQLFLIDELVTLPHPHRSINITLPQAIRCLEILRDTGEVNWKEALQ